MFLCAIAGAIVVRCVAGTVLLGEGGCRMTFLVEVLVEIADFFLSLWVDREIEKREIFCRKTHKKGRTS